MNTSLTSSLFADHIIRANYEMTREEAESLEKRIQEVTKRLQPADIARIFNEVASKSDWQVKKELRKYKENGRA